VKNLKPIFKWAKVNGDVNICRRILIKAMPLLLQHNLKLTTQSIESSRTVEVSQDVYNIVLDIAQEMTGVEYVQYK